MFAAIPGVHAAPGDVVPDQYIIQVRGDAAPAAVAGKHGLAPAFVFQKALNGFGGFIPPGQLRALQNDPLVTAIIPNREVQAIGKPGDTGKGNKGSEPAPAEQIVPEGVKRIGAAPGSSTYTGAGVGVAIVDTGLDRSHSDLKIAGPEFYAYGTSAQDENGHGTHVGGTVAALNNNLDVVGVAPDATLYAVKVLNSAGSGSDLTIIAGLEWVLANAAQPAPIRVVNMSLGRPGSLDDNSALRTAVQNLYNAGISIIVAAGNDCSLEVSQQVPATYPEVIAVASTTAVKGSSQYRWYTTGIAADSASYFTSDGAFNPVTKIGVTCSAPGEDKEDINKAGFIQSVGILSTRLGGGTTRMSGTSMASPHVAGVAALLAQKYGITLSPEQVRSKLVTGATNPSAPVDSLVGCYTFDGDREGVVSAPGALAAP